MTTLVPARLNGRGDPSPRPEPEDTQTGQRGGWFARHPDWPIATYLIAFPLWWGLGVVDYMPVVLAIPMLHRMYQWRATRSRSIRVPPGFGIWLVFLIVMLAGITTISQTAPVTIASPSGTRMISYALRSADYLAVTVMLLYAGNLTERELSRKRLAWWMGLLGIYTLVGGLGGIVDPRFQFTAPISVLVPKSLQATNGQLQVMLHPGFSEVQGILGYSVGRPKAPFDYTNTWGNALAILLPWLLVAWWSYGSRRERRAVVVLFALAAIPAAYSLDRGLWVGLALSVGYLALRYAARGKLAMLAGICGVIALAGVVIIATPLQSLISQRLSHGKSNAVRSSLSLIAIQDAVASPFVGYGDTRHEQGSTNSIQVGKTNKCLSCGSRDIGGNGQLWLLLIADGFVGTGFYLAFFGYGIWRYRRDPTPYGMAAVLVLLLGFVFMIVYQSIGAPLAITMLSYALLWRNERETRLERAALAGADPGSPGPRGGSGPAAIAASG